MNKDQRWIMIYILKYHKLLEVIKEIDACTDDVNRIFTSTIYQMMMQPTMH